MCMYPKFDSNHPDTFDILVLTVAKEGTDLNVASQP